MDNDTSESNANCDRQSIDIGNVDIQVTAQELEDHYGGCFYSILWGLAPQCMLYVMNGTLNDAETLTYISKKISLSILSGCIVLNCLATKIVNNFYVLTAVINHSYREKN